MFQPSYLNNVVAENTPPMETPASSALQDTMEPPCIPKFALNSENARVSPKLMLFQEDNQRSSQARQPSSGPEIGNEMAESLLVAAQPLRTSSVNNMIVEEDEEDLAENEEPSIEMDPPPQLLRRHDESFNHCEQQRLKDKENSCHSRGQSNHSRGQSCHSRGQHSVASSKGSLSYCSSNTNGSSVTDGSSVGSSVNTGPKKLKKKSRSKRRKKRFTAIPLSVGGLAKLADSNVVSKSTKAASSAISNHSTLDYRAVEADIIKFIQEDLFKKGPALIRLASHSALTYKKLVNKRKNATTAGGATRRTRTFPEELRSQHGCMGASELTVAKWMDPIRQRYAEAGLSFADFYTLAGGK